MKQVYRGVLVAAAVLGAVAAGPVAPASGSAWGASWQFNEAAGSRMFHDSSGAGNTGYLGTGVSLTGSALRFTGRDNATVPNSASLNPGTRPFSWAARVRLTGGFINPNIVQKGRYGDPSQWKLDYFRGDAFCKVIGPARQRSVRMRVNLFDGRFHTITCIKHTHSLTISVDGRSASVPYAYVGSITNNKVVTIGGKQPCPRGDCDRMTGLVDWVRVKLL